MRILRRFLALVKNFAMGQRSREFGIRIASSSVGDGQMGSGSLLGSLFQGAFAGGGDFLSNRPLLVGENGPEIVSFGSPGHVTPNHEAFGDTNHVYIDASNSNDPAATEAAVHRAMKQYLPRYVSSAINGVQERHKRLPLSRR
jgi:hypothetical protein